MPPVRRILKLLGAALALVLYVWVAAVRYAPRVKARKALRHGR
jgi:HAMP domain-containing protein